MSASTSTAALSTPPLRTRRHRPSFHLARPSRRRRRELGRPKRTWLASELVDAFEREHPPPDAPYVEDLLLQVMEDELETVLEDGSAEVVAKDLIAMWVAVQGGNHELVQEVEAHAEKTKGNKVATRDGDDDDWSDGSGSEDSSDDEDETPRRVDSEHPTTSKQEPEPVDEDGFTVV